MKTLFKVIGYGIKKRKIIDETEDKYLIEGGFAGNHWERKQSSGYCSFHDTFEEAKKDIILKISEEIDRQKEGIEKLMNTLQTIFLQEEIKED